VTDDAETLTPHQRNGLARRRARERREQQEDTWRFGAIGEAEDEASGRCAPTCLACALEYARLGKPRAKSKTKFDVLDRRTWGASAGGMT